MCNCLTRCDSNNRIYFRSDYSLAFEDSPKSEVNGKHPYDHSLAPFHSFYVHVY